MRKGQRMSSSSESEENQRLQSKEDQRSPCGCSSSDEESSSCSDVEAERVMKRSQRFSSSFSFGEDHQPQSTNEHREELLSKNSNGVPITEVVEAELAAERVRLQERDTFCETNQPPRPGLFRPQELWLAVTRCLSLRWPPCLSINRQSNAKLAYQVDLDQSEDTWSSISSRSTNESSSSTSTLNDRDITLAKPEEEEVKNRGVRSAPPPCRGVSRSSPRLPRVRQATESMLASVILEKETFLRIELVDSGDEKEDLRYRAEWRLSERTKELAEGVWLSRSKKLMD
uniref:uncharacterized protein LOC124074296 n=1 Tax=Scatophagus argus TaxID=75038 RepID=UPI001ED81CB4|nr:uncharacterized protein LOC124074296 [Scatophagus argus]XP_046273001.1 uncharacterized protein LOC124074296 [Scatophagus argus]